MTTVQRAARIFGWSFIFFGVTGFFYTGLDMAVEPERADYLFGLFPINALHNVVHLLLGIWGVLAARTWGAAKGYCRSAGVIYLIPAVLGFVTPFMFGLVPIYGNDVWLHVLLAVPLLFFGFTAREHARAAMAR